MPADRLPEHLEKFARAVPGAVVYNDQFFLQSNVDSRHALDKPAPWRARYNWGWIVWRDGAAALSYLVGAGFSVDLL